MINVRIIIYYFQTSLFHSQSRHYKYMSTGAYVCYGVRIVCCATIWPEQVVIRTIP